MKAFRWLGHKIKKKIRSYGYDVVRHKEISELLNHHNIDIVLDIGANDGRYVSEIRESGWNGPIVSFEPQPAAFRRLHDSLSGDRQWKGHQLGLGSEDALLKMNIHEMDVLSSFLEKVEMRPGSQVIEVPVKRIDHILDEVLAGRSRPFVKMDTQGFEVEIINGFGARTKDVIGWQVEMSIEPLYQNQPKIEEIITIMRNLGFSLWRVLPGLRDPRTLRAFEIDGIFFMNK